MANEHDGRALSGGSGVRRPGGGARKKATRRAISAVGGGAALVIAASLGAGAIARADDAPKTPALQPTSAPKADAAPASAVPVTSPQCVLKGTYPIAKTAIYDAPSGGHVIGTFTGAFAPVTMRDIPEDPASGRARIATSNGTPALRVEGFVDPRAIQLFTTRDLPVSEGHVWVSSAQKVSLVHAHGDQITAELTISGTTSQKVRITAPCDAFALARGQASAMDVPGNARGFLTKGDTIDLYDKPNGDVVLELNMIDGTGQLFWSTESRGGFVHVQARADLTLDAWAKWKDLEPLKKGEMMDQLVPPSTAVTGAQLALDKPPPLVRAIRDVPIRAARDDKAKPVGAIETGAEVYVMETIANWTNVLPKGLGVIPPEGGGFWIPASEAPK